MQLYNDPVFNKGLSPVVRTLFICLFHSPCLLIPLTACFVLPEKGRGITRKRQVSFIPRARLKTHTVCELSIESKSSNVVDLLLKGAVNSKNTILYSCRFKDMPYIQTLQTKNIYKKKCWIAPSEEQNSDTNGGSMIHCVIMYGLINVLNGCLVLLINISHLHRPLFISL